MASSEDERPWPSSTSFGSLPRKENGMPGLGGGIWSQKRSSSFKMADAARRNTARETQLGAPNPHSALRQGNTPSPSTSDRAGAPGALPFAIPLQPTPKAGRSLSHSQGQREPIAGNGAAPPVLRLGLLTEEADPETDYEFGEQLTQTASHPPIGTLQRASTYNGAFDNLHTATNGRPRMDPSPESAGRPSYDGGLEAAFAHLAFDPHHRRAQWQSHLGWEDLPHVNESRRHSLADIPTRRGSFAADERPSGNIGGGAAHSAARSSIPLMDDTPLHTMRATDDDHAFDIPENYKVPFVDIAEFENTADDPRRERQQVSLGGPSSFSGSAGRPRKQLYIISFKCSRVDVFYLLDNTGLHIKEGDIVIVEADRGQDLGTVQHANVTPDQARLYKRKYSEEQYKWLMMFSRNNNPTSVNPNAQLHGESSGMPRPRGDSSAMMANASSSMQGLPRDNFSNLKPKAIKRLANKHEIKMLSEKEGNEAKAKRTCQQKVAHLHLDMEILDAEWQWDFQKLMLYYYADHYINFKDLITDLYRIYKVRIWLSAVNPASFSQHALGQPPSGIGPGAITAYNQNLNNAYTMAYGPDPDPYGAVPPYRIPYETYTPNYPAIPGVANSFAPGAPSFTPTANFQPISDSAHAFPTIPPGIASTGSHFDYNHFYDRSGNNNAITPPAMTPVTPGSSGAFGPYGMLPNLPASHYTAEEMQAYRGFASPWNMNGAGNPNAGGLGRQADLPPPIGTRPVSNGNAHMVSFSNRMMNPAAVAYDGANEGDEHHFSNASREYEHLTTPDALRFNQRAAMQATHGPGYHAQDVPNHLAHEKTYAERHMQNYADAMSRER